VTHKLSEWKNQDADITNAAASAAPAASFSQATRKQTHLATGFADPLPSKRDAISASAEEGLFLAIALYATHVWTLSVIA
jgi:hypothetical protein